MFNPQQPINPWIISYITQHRQSSSRYEIDKYLIELGYAPAEVEIAWYQLQRSVGKTSQVSQSKNRKLKRLIGLFAVLSVISSVLVLVLLKPQFGYYNYGDPDDVVNKAAVGETIGIFTKPYKGIEYDVEKKTTYTPSDTSFLSCEDKTNNLRECFWRRTQNSTDGLIVQFPKSKGLSPENGPHWLVRIVSKQGSILIGEIEDIINYMS